ncbi:ethylbenzene dehydrogenase-related protein [Rhodoplanes roseus]|nr:ethylbenzene dehydrogenase-related protein [Rhodoplanes roseus]
MRGSTTLASLAIASAFALGTPLVLAQEKPVAMRPVPIKAAKATAAPTLDADASDPVWKQAQPVAVEAVKGVNFKDKAGNTNATVQAAYFGDTLYMLVTWDDPTMSVRRFPYQKQPDGSWKKLVDPEDKGGDDNVYYEDKFAMIWNVGKSMFGFDERFGCQVSCHAGEPGKPYGNKYTSEEGEIGDIWHMKYVRGGFLGQIDDQWLDHTRFDPQKSRDAGRKSDASTGGGYQDVKLVGGKPEFMNKDAKPANKGGTYWIKAEDKVPFDDSKFVAGDEVASIVVAPFTGDRGDIKVALAWKDGKWTAELSRKLVTGSKTDVQFDDLSKSYGFGIAFFDNAQVRHAYGQAPLILSFDK